MRKRVGADGRKTAKQKPGPRPKGFKDTADWTAVVVYEALMSSDRFRTRLIGIGPQEARRLAGIALAATADEVEIVEDKKSKKRRIGVIAEPGRDATVESMLDGLIARWRRARRGHKEEIRRMAHALVRAAFPHTGAPSPVVFTPAGAFGDVKPWPMRRAAKVADGASSLPPWEMVSAMGAAYAQAIDDRAPGDARRAVSELRGEGFPILQVLKRLNL